MKIPTLLCKGLGLLAGVGFAGQLWAAPLCPGTALPLATAANSVTFGDAVNYSLPILGINVQSAPGQIQDCIVVATGVNGGPATTNPAGMDDAYQTPNATPNDPFSASAYFRTGDATNGPDPGGAGEFVGDTATTWDTRLSALSAYLAGGQMVVYFNHNQTNSGDSTNQDLFVWAQLALVDDQAVLPTRYFYVTSIPNTTGLQNFGSPGFDPAGYTGPQTAATNTYPSATDAGATFPKGGEGTGAGDGDARFFVRAFGQICLNGPVGVGTPQACDGTEVATVNHNLGANNVAYAVTFPELQLFLNQANFGGYEALQADIRMGCNASVIDPPFSTDIPCPIGSRLNNGYEQIFIGVAETIIIVPEPGSLALLGLALAAIGVVRPRRRAPRAVRP